MEHEFYSYCERHRVGFCGAESKVLQALLSDPNFLISSSHFIPREHNFFFLQPTQNGKNLNQNLPAIKESLINFVKNEGVDTLFLSLGGGAKILGQQLARELNMRCIDFGAMLRALCFLGSAGDLPNRATHSPFFFHVPFRSVMKAIESAFPDMSTEHRLAKAHAQLLLELQDHVEGWTSASADFNFNSGNLERFRIGFNQYRQHYSRLFTFNNETRLERKRFLHFCGKHKLTFEGRLFYQWFLWKQHLLGKSRKR
jgi:hypothetical protein